MMLHLKSVLTEDEVQQMRTALQDAQWSDGRETSGSLPGTIKQNQQLPYASSQTQPLQQAVLNALRRNQLFFSAALPRQIAPPMFNRYGAGGDYLGDHVDVALRMLPNGLRVRTDISCTLFLSDPDEYQGGEIIVADSWEDKRIKLPAGDMLLYDASHVHRVEPVHQGTRYASFFWIESMVRSAEQRKLLFEMDCHLMSVRSRVPEHDPGVTGLTATYHHLLRMWADS